MHTLYKKQNFQTLTVYVTFCIYMHLIQVFFYEVCMCVRVCEPCVCELVCVVCFLYIHLFVYVKVCVYSGLRGSEAMFPSCYVRGELVSVLTPVTAEVAL